MTEWMYTEELRAQLRRPAGRSASRAHDRDVARLLSPWRRHHAASDAVVREG